MICNCEHNNAYVDNLRLVRGNDFSTVHDIVAKYPDDTVVEGFDLNVCTDLGVRIKRDSSSFKDIETYAETWSIIEPKKIKIKFDGLKMKNGSYRVEFFGKFQGKDWRCYSAEKGFGVVESNEEANIPADTIIADGVYLIGTDFTMTYQTQEQADWEEEDNLLPSYIKNKPDLSIYVEKVEGKDLSDNNYSDEEKQKVDNAVPNTREINGKALISDITLTPSDIGALPTSTKYGYSIGLSLNSQDFKLTITLRDQNGNALSSKMVDLPLETMVVSGRYDTTNRAIVLTLQNGNAIDIPVGDLVRGLQPTLVSGVNIKTINHQSILGSGNINIQGGGGSGVQSDWNETDTESEAYIKNKPTIPAAQIQSDWEQDDSDAKDYIKNKPTIPDVSGKADKATTLAGYGITDAKIDSGVITLGNNTITPLTSFTETDPTVPSWAKASSKPSYTASEVGAVPTTRTVNGKALSADITLSASDVNALPGSTVIPDAQIQSDWNQTNTSAKDYIKNKPTISAQVQSDWNQTTNTEPDYIKNKPTIPAAQVQANWNESDTDSKAYIQNKPTIPAAQVQSNWNESDTNSKAYIQNKPTIPAAGIPAGGNAGQVLTKTDGSTDYAVAWRDTNNIFPSAYCTTAAATAAKGASCTFWTATANSYLHILLKNANTNQGALSLNVNNTGAAPIYINGTVSSSTNYTLPAGSYIVFYDGTNYYFRTDGKLTASITGTADGVSLGSLTDVSTTGATNGQVLGYNGSSWEPTNAGGGGGSAETPIVNHGTSDTTFALPPNEFHVWGEVTSLILTLATPSDPTVMAEYMFEFESGLTPTTLSLPATVEWADNCHDIVISDGYIYQVSIVNNVGLWIRMEA